MEPEICLHDCNECSLMCCVVLVLKSMLSSWTQLFCLIKKIKRKRTGAPEGSTVLIPAVKHHQHSLTERSCKRRRLGETIFALLFCLSLSCWQVYNTTDSSLLFENLPSPYFLHNWIERTVLHCFVLNICFHGMETWFAFLTYRDFRDVLRV